MESEVDKILKGLNSAQIAAVTQLDGPCLVIAGAGSGKTKVLTCKVANLLAHGVEPWQVLAVTFTNKAAREMKIRVAGLVGERKAHSLVMGTFHSVFLRFLRRHAALFNFPPGFTVYDKDDSRTLIKRCIKELELDDKIYKYNEVASRISECKNNLISPLSYLSDPELVESDRRSHRPRLSDIYALYTQKCVQQGAMDFDDLLLYTYRLFAEFPDRFAEIRAQFRYILVDEYQDTNHLQYVLIKALAADHRNLTVVGDDAQSIYAFRGARVENILNFSRDYPDAKIFRLERNYRSTKTIVEAANSLIKHNSNKLTKSCYSERQTGEKIEIIQAYTEQEEAALIASSILSQMNSNSARYQDFAVLYRTNAQSRLIEEALRRRNMPYKIYAGRSFYERAEVKSMICYLRLITNPSDDEAFKRVVNYPARGIGNVTMGRIIEAASQRKISITESVMSLSYEELGLNSGAFKKVRDFAEAILKLSDVAGASDAYEVVERMDKTFGIISALREDTTLEGQSRLENVEELFNSVKQFVEEGEEEMEKYEESAGEKITIDLYLQNIALIADSDSALSSSELSVAKDKKVEEEANRISLMTVHSAKGLEFPYVYVAGMEEDLFPCGSPSSMSHKDLEEERRLFYVALTRAENTVKLSWSHSRMRYGEYKSNIPSRFLSEIDPSYLKNPIGEESWETPAQLSPSSIIRQKFTPVERTKRVSSAPRDSEPLPDSVRSFIPDSPLMMKEGERVEHERFGAGIIVEVSGQGADRRAVVNFDRGGRKTLLLKYAKMRIIK